MEASLERVNTLLNKKQHLGGIESEYSKTARTLAGLDKLNECDIYIKSAELSLHKIESLEGIKKNCD